MHGQRFDTAVSRTQQSTFKQDGANPMALPGLLDTEGGFALACEHGANTPELGSTAQQAVHEEPVHDDVSSGYRSGMADNEFVSYRAGKTPPPALPVETQQVIGALQQKCDRRRVLGNPHQQKTHD